MHNTQPQISPDSQLLYIHPLPELDTAEILRGDMHFHTTQSDGNRNEMQKIQDGVKAELQIITATDHDIMSSPEFIVSAKDHGMISYPSTEISLRDYQRGHSMHWTYYAQQYNDELIDILDSTRTGKGNLVQAQFHHATSMGFYGYLDEFYSFFANIDRTPESLSKFDVSHYLYAQPQNRKLIHTILGDKLGVDMSFQDGVILLHKTCFREGGTLYNQFGTRIDDYEPSVETIGSIAKRENAVLSVAHPQVTYGESIVDIDRFNRILPKYIDLGVNAIEINSKAPFWWVKNTHDIVERYNLLETLGSDNHNAGESDEKHADFGNLNPYVTQMRRAQIFRDFVYHLES